MKTLHIRKIKIEKLPSAQNIPAILDQESIPFHQINNANWKEFPYRPDVRFRIAHTGNTILLQYSVTENSIRAVAPHDNGRVWEDSCAEFFVQTEPGSTYYNFECNCAGTLLIEYGKPGDRTHAPLDIVKQVERYSSLGKEIIDERIGECSWQLCLIIPVSAFFQNNIEALDGITAKANFYKCGDKLQIPHFLSWNPIDLPHPCFHCPDFFGEIVFDK